ncbi:hypothetical protein DVH24_027724 [Malus domestica]|uniref:Uncharacterized protein n=1 Tax=Malus domestica TaxID=3750 RepID=A0A498HE43_MALDO|nr:hypothetical protein DVH24_027724 [Malus domestica]
MSHSSLQILSHPDPGSTTSQARLRHNTILSVLGPDHALTVLFLGTHLSRTSQWVTHLENALAHFSFNFGVPTEPGASELPKGLMLYEGEYVHIRHRGSHFNTPQFRSRSGCVIYVSNVQN